MVRVSRKGSLIESSECGCLSNHIIVESSGSCLWVVSVNVCLERKGGGCWVKLVLVSAWKQQGKSVARAELVLFSRLLHLSRDCW